ncbi:MAG: class B sortase [Lachnospiraceae bacterium]|nr:class B sortase [Lachnospiraceae bacterium]
MSNFNYTSSPEYQARVRDQEKIDKLLEKYDRDNPADVDKICQMLSLGTIKFESKVGNEFDDEMFELCDSLKKRKPSGHTNAGNTKGKTGKSTAKPGSAGKGGTRFEDLDDDMKVLVRKELRAQYIRRTVLIVVLALIAVSCIGYFAIFYFNDDRGEKRYRELAELKGSEALDNSQTEYVATITDDGIVVPDVLPEYKTLYNSNKNLIGWIKIDDTIIDYPVMQCGDNEFYLTHNFDSEEDVAGTLFLDCNCDVLRGSDNYIIYGHHLQSGRMFSSIGEYESESYYESHKYIQFDTIYERQLYQVMYAFRSRVYTEDEVTFKYYQFIDANSEEEFNSYMAEMEAESFYDTGVRAFYGDQLLTLSTCDYQEQNGRFVVVAKRIQ